MPSSRCPQHGFYDDYCPECASESMDENTALSTEVEVLREEMERLKDAMEAEVDGLKCVMEAEYQRAEKAEAEVEKLHTTIKAMTQANDRLLEVNEALWSVYEAAKVFISSKDKDMLATFLKLRGNLESAIDTAAKQPEDL